MIVDKLHVLFHVILPKKSITLLAGLLAACRCTRIKDFLIKRFIKIYNVNMKEAISASLQDYPTFNDFFIRHLKSEARKIATAPIICPVDGFLSAFGTINSGSILQAKKKYYSVASLLNSKAMAAHFHNGSFATLYLSPKDYHRVHMPIAGTLLQTCQVPGRLFSVQEVTVHSISQLFARNERFIAYFDTPLGLMAMVLVGATIVGSIGTSWGGDLKRSHHRVHKDYSSDSLHPQPQLPQGGEMGYFKLGSTVIILFANQANTRWHPALTLGQAVQFGQAMVKNDAMPAEG